MSKNAWKLELTSGLQTTDKIGFNHAVGTIVISNKVLLAKVLWSNTLNNEQFPGSGLDTTDKFGFNHAVDTIVISNKVLIAQVLSNPNDNINHQTWIQ